jgi:hypothetical protein
MVKRHRKRRSQFACGHRGFGRYCRRCIRATEPAQGPVISEVVITPPPKAAAKTLAKRQWQQSFGQDPIALNHLPKPIVIKARRILEALNQGVAPGQLQGKRFTFDRTLLRIPVSYRYRLLCRWQAGRIVPLQVLSHEAYNAIARNQKTP